MALATYRFRLAEPGIDIDQLQSETDATAAFDAATVGQIVDIIIDDSKIDDLVESMASRGYIQIGGANPGGTPGDASDFVRRTGDTMTGNLVIDGATADISLTAGARITGVPDVPTANTDAVNANYVQNLVNARDPKESSRLCTGGVNLVGDGWIAAGSGVGKTLTSPDDLIGNNDFDGITAAIGDRILVKDGVGASAVHNGIYTVTQLANGTDPTILTRATDFDGNPAGEVTQGAFTFVAQGTTCAATGFILITPDPITVDTDQLTFTQIAAVDSVVAGAGLSRTINTMAVDLDTAADAQGVGTGGGSSGLEFDAAGDTGQLRVKVDPAGGIQRTGNGLAVELDPAGAIVVGANGLSANVDGVTITIVGNELVAATQSDGSSQLLFGAGQVFTTTTDRYLFPSYSDGNAETAPIQIRASRNGLLRNLRVRHNSPAGNGNNVVYTLRLNGTPTSLAATLASTATDGSDLVDSIAVTAGDLLDIIVTKAAGTGSAPRDVTATVEFTV